MNRKKIIFIILFFIFFYIIIKLLKIDEYFSIDTIRNNQEILNQYVRSNYFFAVLIFILIYVLVSSLPIPGDSVLIITAGYLFGIILGSLYSLFAVTLGAIIAFIIFRFITKNHKDKNSKFNKEIKKRGSFYFLTLRLLPILPTSVVNFIGAVSNLSLTTFIWTTAIGMIPIILIFTSAGKKLYKIKSVEQIFTFPIIIILVLLIFASFITNLIKELKNKHRGS